MLCFTASLTGDCPVWRAAAVQWSRVAGGGIEVTAVCDFGVAPMSQEEAQGFAAEMADGLPPVPTQLWAQNRHVPFTAALTGQPIVTEAVALGYIRTLRNSSALYSTSVTPRITFPADALAATLHNLPEDTFPNGSSE